MRMDGRLGVGATAVAVVVAGGSRGGIDGTTTADGDSNPFDGAVWSSLLRWDFRFGVVLLFKSRDSRGVSVELNCKSKRIGFPLMCLMPT